MRIRSIKYWTKFDIISEMKWSKRRDNRDNGELLQIADISLSAASRVLCSRARSLGFQVSSILNLLSVHITPFLVVCRKRRTMLRLSRIPLPGLKWKSEFDVPRIPPRTSRWRSGTFWEKLRAGRNISTLAKRTTPHSTIILGKSLLSLLRQ